MSEQSLTHSTEIFGENENFILENLIKSCPFWKHVLRIALVGGIIGLCLFYRSPNIYVAETVLMPPTQADHLNASAFTNGGNALGALALAGGGPNALFKDPNAQYIAILKSRSVATDIIHRFNLLNAWKLHSLAQAQNKLDKAANVKSTKEMLLSISVADHDPKLAADIANAFVTSLRTQSQKMDQELAKQKYAFYQEQLDRASKELTAAETKMRDLQKKNSALRIDDQTKLALESIARLQARISTIQVELIAAQHYAGPDNPDIQRLQSQLDALKKELTQQETESSGIILPLNTLPDAQIAYVRGIREYKYSEIVYELLAKQLESARIEESSDGLWLQVLDKAVPPETPSSPPKLLYCVLTGLVSGFLCAVAWAIFRPASFLVNPKP